MATWTFRLRGQTSKLDRNGYIDYRGHDVRIGSAGGRPVLEVLEQTDDRPSARLELDAVFGYIVQTDSTVRVYRRDPSAKGESVFEFNADEVDAGKFSDLDTWDILRRRQDPAGPLGRFLVRHVADVSRSA